MPFGQKLNLMACKFAKKNAALIMSVSENSSPSCYPLYIWRRGDMSDKMAD
jgi:hypothetical protein